MTDTLMLRSDDVRQRFIVTGVVQGVGFRPFVHRIASELSLAGFVGNDSGAVFVEVQGTIARIDEFGRRLCAEAPPLARINTVSIADVEANTVGGDCFLHRREPDGARGHHTDSARYRGMRRLRRRAVQPAGPALPTCVHHLHQLRTAVHHHPRVALRPSDHHHVDFRDV